MPLLARYTSRIINWQLRRILPQLLTLLARGRLVHGPELAELQQVMQQFFGARQFFACDSGSSAIELALEAMHELQPGRNGVVLPLYICPSVIRAVERAGLTPVYTAVRSDLNLDPADVKKKITGQTLAVIIPHLYGYPAEIEECIALIRSSDPAIYIIDDAAAAFGSQVRQRRLGSLGDVGIVSFGPSKKITAGGGGGVVVMNPELLAPLAHRFSRCAAFCPAEVLRHLALVWWNFLCLRYSSAITYWYHKVLPATPAERPSHRKRQMSNLDAALILRQLPEIQAVQQKRARIMAFYLRELAGITGLSFPQKNAPDFAVSKFYLRSHGLAVSRDEGGRIISANPLVTHLQKQGIKTGYGYNVPEAAPGAAGLQLWKEHHAWLDELVWLPVDHALEPSRYAEVTEAIKSFFA